MQYQRSCHQSPGKSLGTLQRLQTGGMVYDGNRSTALMANVSAFIHRTFSKAPKNKTFFVRHIRQLCATWAARQSAIRRMETPTVVEVPPAPHPVKRRIRKKCPHGKRRTRCAECGGAGVCEHKQDRYRCAACGGGSICKHTKLRSECAVCGGGSICEHKRRRSKCPTCGGASICKHTKQRSKCAACGGGSICKHNK